MMVGGEPDRTCVVSVVSHVENFHTSRGACAMLHTSEGCTSRRDATLHSIPAEKIVKRKLFVEFGRNGRLWGGI